MSGRTFSEADLAWQDLHEKKINYVTKAPYVRTIRVVKGIINIEGEQFLDVLTKSSYTKREDFLEAFRINCDKYKDCLVELLDMKCEIQLSNGFEFV